MSVNPVPDVSVRAVVQSPHFFQAAADVRNFDTGDFQYPDQFSGRVILANVNALLAVGRNQHRLIQSGYRTCSSRARYDNCAVPSAPRR